MRRILGLILGILLISLALNFTACDKEEAGELEFSENGTSIVTGIKNKTATFVVVPDSVTEISYGAFNGCKNLKSITLPFVGGNGTETEPSDKTLFGYIFGIDAFDGGKKTPQYDEKLSEVVNYYIPSSLKSVKITGGSILTGAFECCGGIENVAIEGGVEVIEKNAFYECTNLVEIQISDSVTAIKSEAFLNCSSLKKVAIPHSVQSIGERAFGGCSSLSDLTFEEGITSIGKGAFTGCKSLTSVEIPNSVQNIADTVFKECESLSSLTLPFVGAGLKPRNNHLFSYLFGTENFIPSALKTVKVNGGDIYNNAFKGCGNITEIVLPESATMIGNYAFSCCISLNKLSIGNGVKSVGDNAFNDCISLTDIDFSGTKAEWQAIEKTGEWKNNVPITCKVHCTDGDIEL